MRPVIHQLRDDIPNSLNCRITIGVSAMKRSASPGVSPPPLKRKVESTTTSKFPDTQLLQKSKLVGSDYETPEAAVASFFTPVSQKKPEKITWRIVNKSLVVGKYDNKSTATSEQTTTRREEVTGKKRKIAAFDLVREGRMVTSNFFVSRRLICKSRWEGQDSTLITTASGNRFARNARDWKWWHGSVPDRLRELTDKGYII